MSVTLRMKRLALLLLACALLSVPASGACAETPATRLRLSPAVSEIEVGDIVTLEVRAEDVTGLYGYQVYLAYDPSMVQAVTVSGEPADSVTLGSFFSPDLVLANAIDAGAGRVSVMVSNMGSAAVSGSGVLFTLRFKGLARGVAAVRVEDGANESILANTDGMAIPYLSGDATLYVGVQAPAPGGRLCLPMVVASAP